MNKLVYFQVTNTKFTVGLAVVAQSHIHVDRKKKIPKSSLLYHRFDLLAPKTPCIHYNNYATMS